jgi:hypothetical protein
MKTKLLFLLLAMFTVFTACDKAEMSPEEELQKLLPENCGKVVKATLRFNLCGIGLWGSYVLELEDGTIVQPWSAANEEVANFKPERDIVVYVSFDERQKDNRYDNIIRCKALGEYETRISKIAHVKCIVAQGKENCNINATVRNNICGVGLWGALVLELENGEIVQPWSAKDESLSKLKLLPNQKVKIAMTEVMRDDRYNNAVICLAIGPYADKIKKYVRIDCITLIGEPIDNQVYTISAEVVDFDCAAAGVWGGIQFKTEKGEHLQPWTVSEKVRPQEVKLAASQRVTITYTQVAYDDRYKEIKLCPTFAPLPKAIAVKIIDIAPVKN